MGISIAAGVGFSSSASADELTGLILACLAEAGLAPDDLAVIATLADKADDPRLIATAQRLGARILGLDAALLAAQAVSRPSDAARAHLGVASVAEAAARHCGPLVTARAQSAHVTCALARIQARSS